MRVLACLALASLVLATACAPNRGPERVDPGPPPPPKALQDNDTDEPSEKPGESAKTDEPTSQLPDWLRIPEQTGYYVGTNCAPFRSTRMMAAAQQQSAQGARRAIASALESRIASVETLTQQRTDASASAAYTAQLRAHTDQVLAGAEIDRTEVITIEGRTQYCTRARLSHAAVLEGLATASDEPGAPDPGLLEAIQQRLVAP